MGTNTRPEISKRSKYYVEKHRYYELKHFCLQYPIWKKAYNSLDGLAKKSYGIVKTNDINDPTERCVIAMEKYSRLMELVESAANSTEEYIADYILRAVTEGLTYEALVTKYGMPCGRELYYKSYRKFFYELNKIRD